MNKFLAQQSYNGIFLAFIKAFCRKDFSPFILIPLLLLSGCLNLGLDPKPDMTRFYRLSVDSNACVSKQDTAERADAFLGKITLPAYADRSQMVVACGETELMRKEYDRWAEPLEVGLRSTLLQNLNQLQSEYFFQSAPPSSKLNGAFVLHLNVIDWIADLTTSKLKLHVEYTIQYLDNNPSTRYIYCKEFSFFSQESADIALLMSNSLKKLSEDIISHFPKHVIKEAF